MPVFINNVDDYLGPSQACVNPLFSPPPKPQSANANGAIETEKILGTNDTPVAMLQISDTSPHAAHVRSRRRQRPAPLIVQRDDCDLPSSPKSRAPLHPTNDGDGGDYDGQRRPTIVDARVTTQTITKKAKATVTLSDCLSCSGCVTSAEAVLMSHHSIDTLREASQTQNRRIVFTISPASLADLYRHLYLEDGGNADSNDLDEMEGIINEMHPPPSRHDFLTRIATFLRSEFGAEMMIDGALSQRISLVESASEFCYRFRKHQKSTGVEKDVQTAEPESSRRDWSVPAAPSVALSSTRTRYINKQPAIDGMLDDDASMKITTIVHPPGRFVEKNGIYEPVPARKMDAQSAGSKSLPMLASSCPGFVCLVEKTAPSVVPLLSSAKSPMAVAGTLAKACHGDTKSSDSGSKSCYHVAIMPCHDKKLEAGRGDFAWERQALLQYGILTRNDSVSASAASTQSNLVDAVDEDLVKEVDLVLTTGELFEALRDAIAKPKNGEPRTLSTPLTFAPEAGPSSTSIAIRSLLSNTNYIHSCLIKTAENDYIYTENKAIDYREVDTGVHGSGSYADFIFRHAARELFGFELPPNEPLPWKGSSSAYSPAPTAGEKTGVMRRRSRRQESTDLREVTLYENSDGSYSCFDQSGDSGRTSTPVLRFATAYGFKNVQLILQSLSKMEVSKSPGYDYVEIMACPSGCSNGGGQIGANGHRETPRETKQRVKKTVSVVPIIRPTNGGGSLSDTLCGCDTRGLVDNELLRCERFDEKARQLFHTRFHVVPKLELSTGATAGVALSDTKW